MIKWFRQHFGYQRDLPGEEKHKPEDIRRRLASRYAALTAATKSQRWMAMEFYLQDMLFGLERVDIWNVQDWPEYCKLSGRHDLLCELLEEVDTAQDKQEEILEEEQKPQEEVDYG